MSKKIRPRLLALLTTIAIVAAMAGATVTAQQAATATPPANAKSAAVEAATAQVLQETSEVRQLPVLRPIKSGAQSRADIERMIIKNLDEETTPEEMRATELTLKKLGLVPSDFKYRSFIISLLTEQVAGYYDPKAQQFYLADWIELEGQKPVISHELTHALQDQHFNLRRFEKWPKGDSDAELAVHALIEGDATFTMMKYILRKPERMREFLKTMNANASSNEQIENAPRALRESLLFPYEKGLEFVTRLNGRGGWKMVSQAFTDLPQSTEQILHTDKYLARETPVKIELPDIAALLGKGWKRVDYNVNGEWSYYLIMDEYVKSPEVSERAAAGWGGDRYAVYEGPKGEVMIAQITVWDTPKDAEDFYRIYGTRTLRRYEVGSYTDVVSKQPFKETTKMKGKEGTTFMEWNGSHVLILESLPENANVSLLQRKIWQTVNHGRP